MFKKNIGIKISTVIIVSLFSLPSFAQSWAIPAEMKARTSYIPFTPSTAKEGEDNFTKNCVSCHGNPGKGNNLKSLSPIPPDLVGKVTQQRTDGDLFYIITTGRGIMPSFKDVFSEQDRWKVISYIRSFNKQYVQVLSKFNPLKAKLVKFDITYKALTHMVRVAVKATEKTGTVALKNDFMDVYAKRYFGRLQLDKGTVTDKDGIAYYKFPSDLPGDKDGNVEVIASVTDDNYGEVTYQTRMKIGIPTNKPGLTEQRAIWNVVSKSPIWLIVTYTSCVLFLGLFLLYIVFSLWKIRKTGTLKNL